MTESVALLPAINAILNGTTAVLVACARRFVRRGRVESHRRFMLAAVACSALFLTSYLYYHAHVGTVRFQGQGWPRVLYFSILTTHTILAAAVVPLVLITLSLGLRRRDARHRRIARWTYPVWMYVSITGVLVYLMLYHLFAP